MKSYSLLIAPLFCAGSCVAHAPAAPVPGAKSIYQDASKPVEERVKDLVSKLTLDEKFELIVGVGFANTHDVPRLGIPEFKMTDGPFGVRDNGGGATRVYAGGMSLAASFDVDQAQKVGAAIGRDCRARDIHILLGPGMNILRAPFSGRNFEYFGEDPLLDGKIASEYIYGLQTRGVAGTMKHFVGNDQEFDRDHLSSEIDERTLREIYLKPFEMAVKRGVWCAMDSYNPVNGVQMAENDLINNKILKKEWGFTGLLMSDWWALGSTLGSANGGLDLEMPGQAAPTQDRPRSFTPTALRTLIGQGRVTQATIDEKVSRLFRVVFSMGWMDRPQLDTSIPLDDPENDQVALDGAREGIVLLKNGVEIDGKTRVLPLDAAKVKKIVVMGHNAEMAMAVGGGSAHAIYQHGVSLLQGLKEVAGSGVKVIEVPWKAGGEIYGNNGNPVLPEASTFDIRSADAVVACVGFNDYGVDYWATREKRANAEGESINRSYDLPEGQAKVIVELAKLNPRTIVVLNAGGAVETASWIGRVPALIDAFYSGQAEGQAVAEIIFGKTNPSGKLPFSWETKWEESPAYGNFPTKTTPKANTYSEGVLLGYRWFDTKGTEPLFPFGFGLSYSNFSFSNLTLRSQANEDNATVATFNVQNTGTVAGTEVAELYVAPPMAPVFRPTHELKGFARVALQPGEMKTISISVPRADLAYWDPKAKKWTVTPGDYVFQVGDSSRNLPLRGTVKR